jgi:hypothetical protein
MRGKFAAHDIEVAKYALNGATQRMIARTQEERAACSRSVNRAH